MSDSQTRAEVEREDIRVASEPEINREVIRGIALGLVGETTELSPSVRGAIKAWENKEAEKALEMVAGEVMPFDDEDVRAALLEILISKPSDSSTGQKGLPMEGTPEYERYNETKKTAELIGEYLKKPQDELNSELLKIAESYLFTSPVFRELIIDEQGQIKKTEADRISETLLRQPKVREMIRRLYVERLDPSKRLEHDKIVAQLKGELAELMAQVVDTQQIEQDISSKKQELARQQQNILNDPNYTSYRNQQNELHILEENLKEYNNILQRNNQLDPQNVFNSYFGGKGFSNVTEVKQRIAEIRIELQTNDDFKDINNASLRIQQLTSELNDLEAKKQSINPEQQKKLQAQIAEKQAQLQEAESLLLAERISYAGKIQSIIPEALKSYLDEAFQTARDSYIEQTKKSDNEALNQAIDKITARLGRKKAKKGKMETYVADKKKAGELLQQLLTPDGVERLFDPNNGQLRLESDYLKNTYGLTDEEANIFIQEVQNDPEYKHQVASKMAAAVFSDYILKGGRLSQDVVLAMTSTEWGKQLISEGQALVQERRQKLENLFGKGVISRFDELKGKSGEWIKQNWWKVGLAILFILLLLGGKAALGT